MTFPFPVGALAIVKSLLMSNTIGRSVTSLIFPGGTDAAVAVTGAVVVGASRGVVSAGLGLNKFLSIV